MSNLSELSKRPVWVEWIDSSSYHGWHLPSDSRSTDLECITLGFLVRGDDESISVTSSISATGHVSDTITIPWCAITKMQEVTWSD